MGVYQLESFTPDDIDDVPPRTATDCRFCIFQLIPPKKIQDSCRSREILRYAKAFGIGSKEKDSLRLLHCLFLKKRDNSNHLFGE